MIEWKLSSQTNPAWNCFGTCAALFNRGNVNVALEDKLDTLGPHPGQLYIEWFNPATGDVVGESLGCWPLPDEV